MTAANTENPYAGQGSVLLDIGGEVGALVVEMPATMEGVEVEIRPLGSRGHVHGQQQHPGAHHDHDGHPHVAVVARPTRDAQVPSLVFPDLVEGVYELYEKEGHSVRLTAAVTGGEVAQAVWPG